MNRLTILVVAATLSLCAEVLLAGGTFAQSAKELVETWTLTSSDNVAPDGSRTPTIAPNPTGNLTFTDGGRFIWLFLNPELPKFAANSRVKGTPEENAAVVRGSISAYGVYSVSGKDLVLKIEQSTFPNWAGTEQKRAITVLTSDELKWTNAVASTGGVAELAFKRTK